MKKSENKKNLYLLYVSNMNKFSYLAGVCGLGGYIMSQNTSSSFSSIVMTASLVLYLVSVITAVAPFLRGLLDEIVEEANAIYLLPSLIFHSTLAYAFFFVVTILNFIENISLY